MIGVVQNESLAGKIIQGAWLHNDRLRDVGYAILDKHDYRCSKCGLQSRPSKAHPDGMMIPVDMKSAGLAAQKVKDGICLCPLCASATATNWSVVSTVLDGEKIPSPGFLIYFPHQSQADIVRLATFTLICSLKSNDHPLFSVATDISVVMEGLSKDVGSKVPIYSGTNADFVKALARLPDEFYDQRFKIIGPLRWWPNIEYWKDYGRYIQAASIGRLEKEYGLNKKMEKYLLARGAE